jgi:hypothetical protein
MCEYLVELPERFPGKKIVKVLEEFGLLFSVAVYDHRHRMNEEFSFAP